MASSEGSKLGKMTKAELKALFREEQHKMASLFESLTSRDDYSSQEAYEAMESIMDTCLLLWKDVNYQKISSRLVDVMLEQGLAQLFVKIIKSTENGAVRFRWKVNSVIGQLVGRLQYTNLSASRKVAVGLVKSGIIGTLVKELGTYDPNTEDPKQQLLITCALYDLTNLHSSLPNVTAIYRAANSVDVLMKFAKAENVMTRIDSLGVLAQIVNENESTHIAASGESVVTLLDTIHTAAQSDEKQYTLVINIDDEEKEFGTTLGSALETIRNLANNDANKEAIVQHGGLPIITAILRPEFAEEERWDAIQTLWKLSFLESNKDAVLSHLTKGDTTAMQGNVPGNIIKEMKSSDDQVFQNPSQGILYQLGLLDIHKEPPVEQHQQGQPVLSSSPASSSASPRPPPPSYQESMDSPHIMNSYKWDQQERAVKVRDELRKRGYNVWMDVDKMKGNMIVAMANAVDKAEAVLVCVSSAYKTSTNCQHEANYAYKQEKTIIPLMVEQGYNPDGWLGFIIAMKKYIRAYSDDVLHKDMPDLLRELGNKDRAV